MTPPRWAEASPSSDGGRMDSSDGGTSEGTPRMVKGKTLFLVGLLFLATAFSLKALKTPPRWPYGLLGGEGNSLSFSRAPKPPKVVEEGDLPEKVVIPKVGIDLPVLPAKVIDNHWEVSDEGASYLLGSGIPGRKGNAVIYGHTKNHLFGPIRWLEEEAEIKVVNKKGEEFVYKIVETKIVSPETVEVLSPTEDFTLTLYTCAGFLDSQRFVVRAKLQPE